MSTARFKINVTYSQLCIFISNLKNPFNDWSERNFTQGFAWRDGSVSFRCLYENEIHQVNLFINENLPAMKDCCLRAFRVPFTVSSDEIEIGSISDLMTLELEIGAYILQVEFLERVGDCFPEINLRFNLGDTDFLILKADDAILSIGEFDLMAIPAT